MRGRVGVWVVMVMVSAAATARANGPAALEKPAFAATPAELLEAAKAAPAGDWPIVVLRHEQELSIDDQGRHMRRVRAVYVVRTQAGIEDWAALHWRWSPYYQDRPRLRARVVEPSGAVAQLDPKLVTDAPEVNTSPTVYSDRRLLSAPLPRLQIGAVVEYELVATDHQPRLASGDADRVRVGDSVPTSSMRVVLSAPAARKAKLFAHQLPGGAKPVHKLERGRESWSYAFDALAPLPEREGWIPADGPVHPYVGLSTVASWSAVAREYHRIVERRIAEGPVGLPAELPRAPTLETVRAITAWLHRQVRYTGIELGQASIVPWPPTQTLQRGFGDCKDKATLLVALLRQVGLRADVALLGTGPGRDTDPELPGLRSFDHAIVRAKVGGRDVWIDATEDLLPPGRLPEQDQGRRALIAADETVGLALTPSAAAAENPIREVRTFELSELGAATRVTEVALEGGVFEPDQRRWIRDARAEEVKESLTSYARTEYGATYARHSTTAPADLQTPFAMTIEVTHSDRAWTHRDQIEVWLRPSETFAKVPPFLLRGEEPPAPRRADFQWAIPHVYEIENRLILPPGYTPPGLPADRTTPLGSATLTERYRLDGRIIVATFRFDSGKPRLTPAELAILRKELAAANARTVKLEIARAASALAGAGKLKEAIAEVERVIRIHPAEAIHHTELAVAYLQAGMGAAARRAARRAVELEPGNADAHAVLGWVLRRDTFGREHGFDHDRAGALAAYARARQLDPKYAGAAKEHGDLLLRNQRGEPYGAGADLRGGIEALRAAYTLAATEEHGLELARAQLHAGSVAEAERVLRAMEASEARDGMLVAAVAAGPGGPAAAIQLAGSLRAGAGKTTLLQTATQLMLHTRRYDAMRALVAHIGTVAAGSPWERIVQRLDSAAAPPIGRDPAPLAFELTRQQLDPGGAITAFWDAQTADELRPPSAFSPPWARAIRREVFHDLMRAAADVTVTGGMAAWRLEVTSFGKSSVLFAALDRGAAKIIATGDRPAGLGRHVLRLLARDDLATAAQCLDWLVQDAPAAAQMLGTLWGSGAPRDRDAIALAAAVVTGGTDIDRALPIATRCASKQPGARGTCDQAIGRALTARKRWGELEAHAVAWAIRAADARDATLARAEALIELGRFDEADRALDALRASRPADLEMARRWGQVAIRRGDFGEAVRRYEVVLQLPTAGVSQQNMAAWLRLFTGTELSRALELARLASGPDRTKAGYPELHTLASVEAEHGDVHAAMLDGWQAMENIGRNTPGPPDWYVYGRIAEQLGLRDDAIAAYRRVRGDPQSPEDSHGLAQRRLAKLGAAP